MATDLQLDRGMVRVLALLQFSLTDRQQWSQIVGGVLGSSKGIRMKLSQLVSPCVFGHGHMLKTRDDEGFLALQCSDCGQATRVLDRPAIKGPMHQAPPVKGAPMFTVKRVAAQKRNYPRSA